MKKVVALAIGLIFVSAAAEAAPTPDQLSTTIPSISGDEIAVYEAVLTSWLDGEQGRQLVNEKLSKRPSAQNAELLECTKGIKFPEDFPDTEDQKSLVGVQFKRTGIELIDRSKWNPADPGQAIANGKSVEAAVKEGFSNSLISFSQITFSNDGKDALVDFAMVCGSLCGSGSTMLLQKTGTRWAIVKRCRNWIS